MKIALASDHRGFAFKERVKGLLTRRGHEVVDFGPSSKEPADYPDYALPAAKAVSRGECERGILVCNTGIGMSIAANKIRGVRAALCHDVLTAEMSRCHNDANVLCLGAAVVAPDVLTSVVERWLRTEFEGGRHAQRLAKIAQAEQCAQKGN